MSDPRLTPQHGAAQAPRRIAVPTADLWRHPGGPRDSQLLWGERFTPYDSDTGFTYGQTDCGYFGWVITSALTDWQPAPLRVSARGTFVYNAPDLKSETHMRLPFGARLAGAEAENGFLASAGGYVFAKHVTDQPTTDFVATAESILGAPYLWGGRSDLGLDCSGLVQLALQAAGINCPRDSDMQESLGQNAGGTARRGDLIFWNGHVGIMLDAITLLHANAHSMTVCAEPLAEAEARILAKGGGPVTHRRRLA